MHYASLEADSYNFVVIAKQCQDAGCEVLVFFANFNLDRDVTPDDFKRVNAYNDRELIGRAYVYEAEKVVGIDFVIDLRGGLDNGYVRLAAARFPALIQAFVDHWAK